MIIFGFRGRTISGPDRRGEITCLYCGKNEHATHGIIQYFHIFFVPMFPISRQPVMQCLHCRKMLVGDEIDQPARGEIVRQVFTGTQTAITFIGAILVALLILLALVQECSGSSKRDAYIRNPAAGDYYVVKASDFDTVPATAVGFAIMQVSAATGEHVELLLGKTRYSSSQLALQALHTNEPGVTGYFDPAPIKLPVVNLVSLKSKGSINSVERR